MGYLVFCVGIGNTNVSFFHLFNHAFFKCLLFVAAGTIIHALINEQDIRKMGGLFKLFPFTLILIMFASFSLMGLPFFSGYYSKEKILEYSFYIYNHSNFFAFWFGSLSAFLTSIYSMRLIFFSFFNIPNNFKKNYIQIHTDLKFYLNIVLFILGLGSIFSGFLLEDLIIGIGNDWLLFTSTKLKIYNIDLHLGQHYLNLLTFFYTFIGIFISFVFFFYKKKFNLLFIKLYSNLSTTDSTFKLIYNFFGKRWFLNLFYNRYVASVCFFLGYRSTFILLDKGFFEAPSLLSIRFLSYLTSFLSAKFYRFYFFGELLIYLFLVYSFFYFIFFLDLSLMLESIFPENFAFLESFFFSFFFFAVPRKRKRTKTLPKLKNIKSTKSLYALFLNIFKTNKKL